jgi:hypothetical protein
VPFHNPYNFVPALPRDDDRMPEGLRDGAPAGHHRWHENLLSGSLDVRMSVVTPLLALRERETIDGHRHLDVATTTDADGVERVDLVASSVKGMLRSAFEAVTNSRLGVFDHDQAVGYRSDVASALTLRPAIVTGSKVEFLGELVLAGNKSPAVIAVPAWEQDGAARRYRLRPFAHRQTVEALISRTQVNRRWTWQVEALLSEDDQVDLADPSDDWFQVRGVLHMPGPNIKNKKAERLFVTEIIDGNGGKLSLTPPRQASEREAEELLTGLTELIEHQRAVHEHAGRSEVRDRDGHKP